MKQRNSLFCAFMITLTILLGVLHGTVNAQYKLTKKTGEQKLGKSKTDSTFIDCNGILHKIGPGDIVIDTIENCEPDGDNVVSTELEPDITLDIKPDTTKKIIEQNKKSQKKSVVDKKDSEVKEKKSQEHNIK